MTEKGTAPSDDKVKVDELVRGILADMRDRRLTEDVDFPEARATNLQSWGPQYAMLGTVYFETEGMDSKWFDHDGLQSDIEKAIRERVPSNVTVEFYWGSQEIEFVGPYYQSGG